MESSSAGHVNQENWASSTGKKKENTQVRIPPPMKPSHVLLGDNSKKRHFDELFAHAYATEVSRHVIHDHSSHGEEEPEEAVQGTAREKLRLADHHHHRDDGPHQLAELEADEAGLEGQHRYHEEDAVEREDDDLNVLREVREVHHVLVSRTELMKAFTIYVEHGEREPGPLDSAEQRHRLLLRLLVANIDQFSEKLRLSDDPHEDAVQVPSTQHRAVEDHHTAAHCGAHQHLIYVGLVGSNSGG